MDEQPSRSADEPQPTEEELRAFEQQLRTYEEQLKHIRVEDVLIQTVVSLINLGARRAGLVAADPAAPEAELERDPEQLRLAIEGARALLPLLDGAVAAGGVPAEAAGDLKQLREALSQLQMAYATQAGAGASPANQAAEQSPQGPGQAQASGRLWVPGQ